MRALVVKQPWAWAIIEGHKRFENRSWTTKYRGPVAIIAGASRSKVASATQFLSGLGIERPAELPFGCILGVVSLVDIILPSQSDDPFAEGPFCWVLDQPVKLERPLPFRGQLGLFRLPTEVLQTENL